MFLIHSWIGEGIQVHFVLIKRVWSFVRIPFALLALTQSSQLSHNCGSCTRVRINFMSYRKVWSLIRTEEGCLIVSGRIDPSLLLACDLILLHPWLRLVVRHRLRWSLNRGLAVIQIWVISYRVRSALITHQALSCQLVNPSEEFLQTLDILIHHQTDSFVQFSSLLVLLRRRGLSRAHYNRSTWWYLILSYSGLSWRTLDHHLLLQRDFFRFFSSYPWVIMRKSKGRYFILFSQSGLDVVRRRRHLS